MKSRSSKKSSQSFSRSTNGRAQKRPAKARNLLCEPLEARQLMTVVFDNVPSVSTSDGGGPVINHPHVELVFWGPNWGAGGNAESAQIASKYASILGGPYLSGLSQYRGGMGSGSLFDTRFVTDNTPPASFNAGDVSNMLKSEFGSGHVPDPTTTSDMYYFVVPQSPTSSPGIGGEHTYDNYWYFHNIFDFGNTTFHYGFTVNGSDNVDSMTYIFSHELAEGASDPEGNAIQVNPRDSHAWNEVCDGTAQNFSYRVNGVLEQAYFSQVDHGYIVPDGNSQKFYLSDNGGTLTINGDQLGSPNDTINVGRNGAGGVMVTMNGQTVSFDPGEVSHVQVNPGGGTDTINILATVVPTDVTGGGGGTVNVGDANGVQDITSTLNISDPPSRYAVNVSDVGDPFARTVTLDTSNPTGTQAWQRIHGLSPADINIRTYDVNNLTVTTGSGADTVNLKEIGDSALGNQYPVQIFANGAATTINVGDGSGVQHIYGTLTLENTPAHNIVNIDDTSDRSARTVTFHTTPGSDGDNFGTISGLGPADINYEYIDTSSVNVTLGVGGDTVNVQATGCTTNISGGGVLPIILAHTVSPIINPIPIFLVGGNNTINIGNNSSVQSIQSQLTIENPYGHNTVNVDDGSDTTARTANLDTTTVNGDTAAYGSITGLAPAQIRYEYDDTSALNVTMGVGGNTVNVHTTGVPTSFDGGSVPFILQLAASASTGSSGNLIIPPILRRGGPDTYNITNGGSMQGINGALNIENTWGLNTITMDDSADTTAGLVTLSSFTPAGDTPWQKVHGLAPADINYEGNDVSQTNHVTVDGGSGGNTFSVASVAPFNSNTGGIDLNTGAGSDTVNVAGTAPGMVFNINGQGGDDSFNVDFSAGNIAPGTISCQGGAGTNSLTVNGSGPADAFTVQPGHIIHGTSFVDYANMQSLTFSNGAFDVTGDLNGPSLSTAGGGTAVSLDTTQHVGGMNLGANTLVRVAASAVPVGKTIFCTGMSIAAGAKLDLTNNALQLNYGAGPDPIAMCRALIASACNGGAWNGDGMTTSVADANHALGYGDSADGVVAGLPANTILVRYTRYGDVNLDGTVSFADMLTQAQNRGLSNRNWDQGDMDYDGVVGFSDLLKLAQNYGQSA